VRHGTSSSTSLGASCPLDCANGPTGSDQWDLVLISACVAWLVSRRVLRENTARELLSEALAVQALEEAWIVEGYNGENFSMKISEHPKLREGEGAGKFWLRRVEVRAILDEALWNSPSEEPYGFVSTRRAWIVRNEVRPGSGYPGPTREHYPALISSRGREELCGWIERVQNAYRRPRMTRALTDDGLNMLRPLLIALAQPDRVQVLRSGLSSEAIRFLERIRSRWGAVSRE
jgi:hypothetical protein